MSSRDLTMLVWVLLGLALVAIEVAARRPGSRLPTFGELMVRVMRTPSGRVGVLAAWLWVGLHYFSR